MSETALVNLALTALLVAGLFRRSETIMFVLCTAFLAALGLAQIREGAELRPLLAALDAFVTLAMLAIWSRHHSQRARVVGFIGFVKCAWALSFLSYSPWGWYAYAAFLNGCFLLQTLVAGGFTDGIAAWIFDWWRGGTHRRAGLYRDVG